MRALFWALIAIMAAVLAACAEPDAAEDDGSRNAMLLEGTGATAIVSTDGDNGFVVEFAFDQPQALMFFSRSGGDWRTGHWVALDEGVALERIGGFDAMVFDTPRTGARFRVTPWFGQIRGDYSPFVQFSDGAIALFTGQFELLAIADRDGLERLNGSLATWSGEQSMLGVQVRSDDRIVMNGAVFEGSASDISRGDGAFIYIGDGLIETGESYIGVLDRGLPDWIVHRFDADMSAIFAELEMGWESQLTDRATLFFAFEGFDNPGFSNKGGVSRNVLMLQSSGEALREPSPQILAYLQWFFAHESAHLFQNTVGLSGFNAEHAWVVEGMANTMANTIVSSLDGMPEGARINAYRVAYSGCVDSLADGRLADAPQRGFYQAHYHCGDLIGLMAWNAAEGMDIYDIGRGIAERLQWAERADGTVYFETLDQLGVDGALIGYFRDLVEAQPADPAMVLQTAMREAGLNPQFDSNGQLVNLDFPQ